MEVQLTDVTVAWGIAAVCLGVFGYRSRQKSLWLLSNLWTNRNWVGTTWLGGLGFCAATYAIFLPDTFVPFVAVGAATGIATLLAAILPPR